MSSELGLSVQLTAPNGRSFELPTGLFIDNEFVKGSKGETLTSIDPGTATEIAKVHAASQDDVNKAVNAARAALKNPEWKKISGSERGQLMARLADLIEESKEVLATIEAWDNGKPYTVALDEDLNECISVIRYYSGWADKIHGQTIGTLQNKLAYTLRQPIGVCGQIIPWNYPLSMACWKLGPALACGNAVVLKPAENTPLSILYLATLIKKAGFPPGVVNIVNGTGSEAGSAICEHKDVDKVAFTGSTATARSIMKMAAGTLKNITLETGGKSPLLVFPDAELDQAVKWSYFGIMSNQGQVCTSTSRIIVHDDIYDEFIKQFVEQVKTTKIGPQFEADSFHGPQVSKAQFDRILAYIEQGKKESATLAYGGEDLSSKYNGGYFITPTVFTDVTSDMKIYREEIFGPVVVIRRFSEEAQALEYANELEYGLGAAVFTRDIQRAHRIASEFESGMVWINSSQDADATTPFGGVKQSGIGRELGEAGLEAYSQVKTVHLNLGSRL
ncbi:aldehyde dehydrogenase ALDH [Ascosphaera apis ARSEF 7405]|uniref:aldehyde dehydrogenase (NAD(+)) n=1 Tax=Ascosphaera apis ARSEF 7405 TaxID=392613 RepID=A0A167Z908_9EURO|nr:aldehyde dehydrogenase ALDH [Ascosphaera apis ARSEF 7405]